MDWKQLKKALNQKPPPRNEHTTVVRTIHSWEDDAEGVSIWAVFGGPVAILPPEREEGLVATYTVMVLGAKDPDAPLPPEHLHLEGPEGEDIHLDLLGTFTETPTPDQVMALVPPEWRERLT